MAASINASTSAGVVTTADTTGNLNLQSNGTTIVALTSTGAAVTGTLISTTGIAVGGATAQAGGIAFPATQVAVTDVNTLDDYEEGTWTPTLSNFTAVGATTVAGTYTKIGNQVTVYATISAATTLASTGGSSNLSNLPFVAAKPSTCTVIVFGTALGAVSGGLYDPAHSGSITRMYVPGWTAVAGDISVFSTYQAV